MEDIEILEGCIQWPIDERNYKYWDIYWNIDAWTLPSNYFINDNEFQNQADWYPYWCVFFSQSMAENEMNFIEWSKERSTWWQLCDYALSKWLFNPESGAMIISWPKVWVALWFLSWYAEISTLDEIKHSIANNRPVQCGSNKLNFSKIILEEKAWYWHSVHIVWYDDDKQLLKIKESYWKGRWDWWYQYLRYSDIWLLYPTKFSLIDKQDKNILLYKKRIMEWINIEKARDAYNLGIWNWLDATKPASREETATMILRAIEKLKNWEI